jgi:hypothetical protein
MSSALATTLQLEFVDTGGKPEQVIARFEGQKDIIIKDPWSMELPKIPEDKWELRFRLIIPLDTTQSSDGNGHKEVEVPIRFSRYHAQELAQLRVPIYILKVQPLIINSFIESFEGALQGEKEKVQGLFKARYAYLRAREPYGPFGLRILAAYLNRAWDYQYGNGFRYVSISDDVVNLIQQLLDDSDDNKSKAAQKKFKTGPAAPTTDAHAGKPKPTLLDTLRYESWDDLKLVIKTPPQPRDENARCLLIKFYLGKLNDEIKPAVTNVLSFTEADWKHLREMAEKPPCKGY